MALVLPASALDAGTRATIERAVDYGYRQQYDSAAALVRPMAQSRPSDPAGSYWQSALVQLLIYDSGNPALIDSFYRLCDSTVALCNRRLVRAPSDTMARFYLGMTQLNRANLQSWQQKKLAAARTIMGASGNLKAAARMAPGEADFAFGVGMLEYFQAYFGKLLTGRRGQASGAYALVRRAASSGTLCRTSAEFSLAWMLGEDGMHDSAVAHCRQLLARYPGNRSGLRLLRDNLLAGGRCREAVETGTELERSIRATYPRNRYGLAENWLKMALAYEKLGQKDSALTIARRIVLWEPYAARTPWLPNYVKEAKALRQRLGS